MPAMSQDELKGRAEALSGDLTAWRRDLHRRPELGFEEHETAAYLKARLEPLGLDELREGVAQTGVVGVLRAPESRGPAVLLRADMDALPIQEVEGRPYVSEIPGRMHACGHDGHMSMLLGAATLLSERRGDLKRDVLFCFQPGEEGFGGADKMIQDGVLDLADVGEVYGLHLWSTMKSGTFQLRPGPLMAAQDEFEATFVGRGGHAALPHQTIDPLVAAAQAVAALQTVVARAVDPLEAAVVSVGVLEAGTACNIIPDTARFHGTMRSFREDVRATLRRRVQEVIEGTAAAAGCKVDYKLHKGYPAVVNDGAAAAHMSELARDVVGDDNVIECPPMACAEDFSYFLNARPGAFAFLGAGGPDRPGHHTPEFDIDESVLPRGAELLARLALQPAAPSGRARS
ncbi:hypothetical protein ABI59_07830 [Acidobacteria bacterium Mor1]|nr:hypothetical protein ABI59_07830 [Acidobacteria bacterium Mor1]